MSAKYEPKIGDLVRLQGAARESRFRVVSFEPGDTGKVVLQWESWPRRLDYLLCDDQRLALAIAPYLLTLDVAHE